MLTISEAVDLLHKPLGHVAVQQIEDAINTGYYINATIPLKLLHDILENCLKRKACISNLLYIIILNVNLVLQLHKLDLLFFF